MPVIKEVVSAARGLELISQGYKPWSPWYEWKCRRLHNNQRRIAEEIDGDQDAASSNFFPESIISQARNFCRPPLLVGRLIYDEQTCEPLRFVEEEDGPLELWQPLVNGKPSLDDYAIGCDVSAGVGATPSTMAMLSKRIGEKTAQYANSKQPPDAFARCAIAHCRWFFGAQLNWEVTGPGITFTSTIRDHGFRNVRFRPQTKDTMHLSKTDLVGFVPQGNKPKLLEDFKDALGNEYMERSHKVLNECSHYRYGKTGLVEQAKAVENDDPKAARDNHGDHVTASALAWLLVKESRMLAKPLSQQEFTQVAKPGSVAWLIDRENEMKSNDELYGGLRL